MNSVQRQLHEAHKARRERLGAKSVPNLVLLPSVKKQLEDKQALEEAAARALQDAEENASRQLDRLDEQRRKAREDEIAQRLMEQLPPELFFTEAPVVRVPSLSEIRREVCDYFQITQHEMMSNRRKASLVLARHFAYFVARSITGASLTQIGRAYKRDHTSVVYAVAKMEDLIQVNSSIAQQYRYFENKLAYRQAPHSYWGA